MTDNIIRILKYTKGVQEQLGIKNAEPEPWLHIGLTTYFGGKDPRAEQAYGYVIFVWDTRKIVARGTIQRWILAKDVRGTVAEDNYKPLQGGGSYRFVRKDLAEQVAMQKAEDEKAKQEAERKHKEHRQKVEAPGQETIRIYKYDNNVKEQIGSTVKPEPWLHIAITNYVYAIFVWDSRKIVEFGELKNGKPKHCEHANDNRQPLVGSHADMFKLHAQGAQPDDKDWQRAADAVHGKSNIIKLSQQIKDKDKAVRRFAAYAKASRQDVLAELKKDRADFERSGRIWSATSRQPSDAMHYAYKAMQLGATWDELANAYKDANPPQAIRDDLATVHKKSGERGETSAWAIQIERMLGQARIAWKAKYAGGAITFTGRDAMRRNGVKWTEGIQLFVWPGTPQEGWVKYDAVTDEGGGAAYYIWHSCSWDSNAREHRTTQRDIANALIAYANNNRPK